MNAPPTQPRTPRLGLRAGPAMRRSERKRYFALGLPRWFRALADVRDPKVGTALETAMFRGGAMHLDGSTDVISHLLQWGVDAGAWNEGSRYGVRLHQPGSGMINVRTRSALQPQTHLQHTALPQVCCEWMKPTANDPHLYKRATKFIIDYELPIRVRYFNWLKRLGGGEGYIDSKKKKKIKPQPLRTGIFQGLFVGEVRAAPSTQPPRRHPQHLALPAQVNQMMAPAHLFWGRTPPHNPSAPHYSPCEAAS